MAWTVATPAEIRAAARDAASRRRRRTRGTWSLIKTPSNRGVIDLQTGRDAWGRPAPRSTGTTYTPGSPAAASTGYTPGMSDADILAEANRQAQAQIAARSAVIERLRAQARARAERDRTAIIGLGDAQQRMLSTIPGELSAIANQAGTAIAGYGAGYSKNAQDVTQKGQEANAATVATQTGGTAPGAPTIDPTAVQNASYAVGGDIPATETSSIGAASANAAAGMPAVVARAATEDIMQRMADAAAEDSTYRDQLLALNDEVPGLVTDAVDRLRSIENDRFQQWKDQQGIAQQNRDLTIRERAELANEAALGNRAAQDQLDAQAARDRIAISRQNLKLRSAKQAADLRKAEAEGRYPDSALSKVYGYVVDKAGNPILDAKGARIPVAKSAAGKAQSTSAAASKATSLRGNPVKAPDLVKKPNGQQGVPAGRYAGRPGAKGLFPDGTTNDPNRAKHDGMTFAQALSYLMQNYGLSRAEARKVLISTGWKPGT